jgi:hypothetical protein
MSTKKLVVCRIRIKETGEEVVVRREGKAFEVRRPRYLQWLPWHRVEVIANA